MGEAFSWLRRANEHAWGSSPTPSRSRPASVRGGHLGHGGGAFGAEDVVGPEGTVEVDPALDAVGLVGGEFHVVVSGVQHVPEAALEGPERAGRGLRVFLPPLAVEVVDPALGDEGAVGRGDLVGIERGGEVDLVLVGGVVASDALCVPDGLDDFLVGEGDGAPGRWPQGAGDRRRAAAGRTGGAEVRSSWHPMQARRSPG